MSLAEKFAQNRRIVILQALAEDSAREMNEGSLGVVLRHVAQKTHRDVVRADMTWLQEQGLVEVSRIGDGLGGEIYIAKLTNSGLEVSEGRSHPGVARPALR